MFKIWAKVISDGKIVRQTVYENPARFTYSGFFTYLAAICEELDIATPILLKSHIFNYAKFNMVTFIPRDFTEAPEFDKLVLENVVI